MKRIDLRENVFNFMRQEVYTKDTILLDVNSLMYYRISDVKAAIYEVEDLQGAIVNVAQTQLKEVFGQMTFSEAMQSQAQINKHMKKAFGPRFSGWGIKVERMELLDILPKQGESPVNIDGLVYRNHQIAVQISRQKPISTRIRKHLRGHEEANDCRTQPTR